MSYFITNWENLVGCIWLHFRLLARSSDLLPEIIELVTQAGEADNQYGMCQGHWDNFVMGLTLEDAAFLQTTIQEIAGSHDATPEEANDFGERYVIDFPLRALDSKRTKTGGSVFHERSF